VVYNGLNFRTAPWRNEAFETLRAAGFRQRLGILLHVAVAVYKNKGGLIAYIPVTLPQPFSAAAMVHRATPKPATSPSAGTNAACRRVLFFQNLDNATLQAAYSHARAFLFPSFARLVGVGRSPGLRCR